MMWNLLIAGHTCLDDSVDSSVYSATRAPGSNWVVMALTLSNRGCLVAARRSPQMVAWHDAPTKKT